MDRDDLSAAIIQEMGAVFTAALAEALPALLADDLAGIEQRLRRVGRAVLGPVVERVMAARAVDAGRGVCPECAGLLRLVDRARPRHLHGLVGDYTLRRAYYRCAACERGQAPLDEALGLGTGSLAPGLAQVVCREGVAQGSFEEAVESVAASVGVAVTAEGARRATEGRGAVAEAEVQTAMARVARGQPAWTPVDAAVEAPDPASDVLAVEVDGVYVHRDDGWPEMKVVTGAPLGPGLEMDADTGRERLCWGRASYGAGCEEAQAFWGRAHVEAGRRGLGTPTVRTVVALGDGAPWIWRHARAFLALPGVAVVEIIDLYHAYEYLWSVGNAVFGERTPAAAAWVEPLKTRLYTEGVAPLHAALTTLAHTVCAPDPAEDAATESAAVIAVRRALEYVTTNAARLDYPAFIARRLPIGSGAVESGCKSLVQARAKGAGMRWSGAGAQHVIALRALRRSGRWDAFWQDQPQRTRLRLVPRRRQPSTRASLPPPPVVPPLAPAAPPADAAPAPPPPRPLRPAADHLWRRAPIGRPRSA